MSKSASLFAGNDTPEGSTQQQQETLKMHCEQLISNPAFVEGMDRLKEEYQLIWYNSKETDVYVREAVWDRLHALEDLNRHLRAVMDGTKIKAKDVSKNTRRGRSMFK